MVGGFGVAMAGASMASGLIGARKARTSARTDRKRTRKSLKYGRSIYSSLAEQGLEQMRLRVSESLDATSQAKREVAQSEILGVQDINTMLSKQLAAMRTGVGGSVGGSTAFSQGAQRGAISDTMQRLLTSRAQGGRDQAQLTMAGNQQVGSARSALNSALQDTGKFKYGIQQDMAAVWGQFSGGTQASPDFGGLGAMLGGVDWGSIFGEGTPDPGLGSLNGKPIQGPIA